MLPRFNRLPATEIPRVMKNGKRVARGGITLIYKTNTDSRLRENDKTPRFAFIVSTKVDKRATVRNRIRRLMSESVRHLLPTTKQPIDAVCIGSRHLVGLKQEEVEKRINEIFHP